MANPGQIPDWIIHQHPHELLLPLYLTGGVISTVPKLWMRAPKFVGFSDLDTPGIETYHVW